MNHYATYSPEDNKIRIYPASRLDADREWYDNTFKAAGYRWAAKQECFVCPRWTPRAEDIALELCGEIDDEDYSPEERAADRAERFSGYRDKRRAEAHGHADNYDTGPEVFGHQSQARAKRQAARHDRHRGRACSQWSKAEYWQERTAGVIAHALHRSSASVRRGRIKRLEAEQRKHEKSRAEAIERWNAWQRVATMDGATTPVVMRDRYYMDDATKPAGKLAYTLANVGSYGFDYEHPRTGDRNSLYSLLTDPLNPITPAEAAEIYLSRWADPAAPDSRSQRWSDHYNLRLTYERAMLEAEGGFAGEDDIEPGGFFGGFQVVKVNKSPATGRATSVVLLIDGKECRRNIERLGSGKYRPPTDDERAEFAERVKSQRAAAKKIRKPSLINPTPEDAERLQAEFNSRAKHPSEVWYMTQAEYSARSKGSYGACETITVTEKLQEYRKFVTGGTRRGGRVEVFKVRTGHASGQLYAADRVVVLTDKPQKPIPWDAVQAARADQPTTEGMFHRLGEIVDALNSNPFMDHADDQSRRLIWDAEYVGWAWSSSSTQHGLTDEGKAAYERYREVVADGGTPVENGTIYAGAVQQ